MAAITELKLRTNFILDRMKFLESVCEAVQKEDTQWAHDMLTLLLENDYPSIIARLLSDPNLKTRDYATWTLANLLGSDRKEVRAAANEACLGARAVIFDNLLGAPNNSEIQKSTAYLLFNWLKRFGKNAEVDEQVLRLLETGFVRNEAKKTAVRLDLLHAAVAALRRTQAGTKAAREVVRMIRGNTHRQELALLIEAFGEICSEDCGKPAFASEDHGKVLEAFTHLLVDGGIEMLTAEQRWLVLWSLSNFVCEEGAADRFFANWVLRAEVMELCESEDDGVRGEAGWVLANAIARASNAVGEDIGTDYGLRYALCSVEAGLPERSGKPGSLFKAIHEALDRLSELEALFAPLEESEDEATVVAEEEDAVVKGEPITAAEIAQDERITPSLTAVEIAQDERITPSLTAVEIAQDEQVTPGLTAAQICEMAGVYDSSANNLNLPFELPNLLQGFGRPCGYSAVEAPLPSALELVAGQQQNHNGSAALRGLVFALKNSGGNWVQVPAGTSFTIEDLTLLGTLGYTISNGQFGINPYLASVRYF